MLTYMGLYPNFDTFTPVWIVEPVFSLVTGHASLLYYLLYELHYVAYSFCLSENRFSVNPLVRRLSSSSSSLLSLSLYFFFRSPVGCTKTTGFLFSLGTLMRAWLLLRAVKMYISCVNHLPSALSTRSPFAIAK